MSCCSALACAWGLRRFVRREFGWHERLPTVLLSDPPPGEETHVPNVMSVEKPEI
jgi:hypothetical protein